MCCLGTLPSLSCDLLAPWSICGQHVPDAALLAASSHVRREFHMPGTPLAPCCYCGLGIIRCCHAAAWLVLAAKRLLSCSRENVDQSLCTSGCNTQSMHYNKAFTVRWAEGQSFCPGMTCGLLAALKCNMSCDETACSAVCKGHVVREATGVIGQVNICGCYCHLQI